MYACCGQLTDIAQVPRPLYPLPQDGKLEGTHERKERTGYKYYQLNFTLVEESNASYQPIANSTALFT
jgi:hypothetical protein